jgi:spore photoproduct lyase
MNFSSYYTDFFKRIYITGDALRYKAAQRALQILAELPVKKIRDKHEIPDGDQNRRTLFISTSRGQSVTRCPGSRGQVCCNYLTLDLYMGCMLDCSYCIMQGYLNFAPLTVYVNTAERLCDIKEIIRRNPGTPIRIGSGEVGDSLALDPLFELSRDYIRGLAAYRQVYFELKTKTNFIDHLLDISPKGNTVIGFSLNPQEIISREEGGASSLEARLDSALAAVGAGYLVAFHFDPIILVPDWERMYRETVRMLSRLDYRKIAWISLGTMRYTSKLRAQMEERAYLYAEFFPCRDGKYRYLWPLRIHAYALMREWVGALGPVPLYMCMESRSTWRHVFGKLPGKINELCAIFTNVKKLS